MATAKRIYSVRDKLNTVDYLVKASTPAQAVRHITRNQFEVEPATAMETVSMMEAGVKVQDAEEQLALPGVE